MLCLLKTLGSIAPDLIKETIMHTISRNIEKEQNGSVMSSVGLYTNALFLVSETHEQMPRHISFPFSLMWAPPPEKK